MTFIFCFKKMSNLEERIENFKIQRDLVDEWWWYISCIVKLEDIENNPDFPWEWTGGHNGHNNMASNEMGGVSRNPNINMSFVLKNLDKNWNWEALSENTGITLEDIDKHIYLPWYWDSYYYSEEFGIGSRSDLTIDFVIKYVNCPYKDYWKEVSKNPSITLKDIDSHPNLPWDWDIICESRPIILEFVLKYSNDKIAINEHILYKINFKETYGDFVIYKSRNNWVEKNKYYLNLIRTRVSIKEELIKKVFHPNNVAKWLETGGWPLVDMMFGN